MDILTAIILGFVEGATEFIPVSSSGHLILAREILGITEGGLSFDAVLQLSASCALLVYFWKDILHIFKTAFLWIKKDKVLDDDKILIKAIFWGTIPAVIFGLLLEDYMDTAFRNIDLVAVTLILGSILFYVAQKFAKQNETLTLGKGIMIGVFQCLALVPGVSRSGATISGGLLAGLKQVDAVRFSFLLSIPVVFGAGLKKLFEVWSTIQGDVVMALIIGSITAFITGLVAIGFLIRFLKNNSLNIFIVYRIVLAVIILSL
ncbi:MAG: undecaprenyl-diphosphatase UppP [Patescibacteria group bacterium]